MVVFCCSTAEIFQSPLHWGLVVHRSPVRLTMAASAPFQSPLHWGLVVHVTAGPRRSGRVRLSVPSSLGIGRSPGPAPGRRRAFLLSVPSSLGIGRSLLTTVLHSKHVLQLSVPSSLGIGRSPFRLAFLVGLACRPFSPLFIGDWSFTTRTLSASAWGVRLSVPSSLGIGRSLPAGVGNTISVYAFSPLFIGDWSFTGKRIHPSIAYLALSVPSSLGIGRSLLPELFLAKHPVAFSPLFIGDWSFTRSWRRHAGACQYFQSPLHWGLVVHSTGTENAAELT